MILALWALQEVKGDEARHPFEMAVALEPDLLEVMLRPFLHFESVHGNEQDALLR
jgi:hypothetical protein